MIKIFEQNQDFLARYFPNLAGQIRQGWPEAPVPIELVPGKKQWPTVRVGERLLHSRYDPIQEASRWALAHPPASRPVIIMLGWGLGYPVLEWVRHHGSDVEGLVMIEPYPALFRHSMALLDFRALTQCPRVEIVVGTDAAAIHQALFMMMEWILCRDLQIIPLPFADLYPPAVMQTVKQEIQHVLQGKERMLTHMAEMGDLCQRHVIQNIPVMACSWLPRDIAGCAQGQAAVIVAAGPSLNRNIHTLAKAQGKAWILAADTSLRVLDAHGITAQMVVSKDPTERNEAHFAGMENRTQPVLAFDPQVSPAIPAKFIGPKLCMPNRNPGLHAHLPGLELTPPDRLPLSTNVALAAFNLAVLMGCDPILFVGLDLCFSNAGGKSHVDGSALQAETQYDAQRHSLRYRVAGAQDQLEPLLVEDIQGNWVPTTPAFFDTLRLLEQQILSYSGRCIDATEGGARIAGTEVFTLDAALALCTRPLDFSRWLQMHPQRNEQALIAALVRIGQMLEQAQYLAEEAFQTARDFEQIKKQIETETSLFEVLHHTLERLLVEMHRPNFWDDPRLSPDRLVERRRLYVETIARACRTHVPEFNQAMESIHKQWGK